MIYLKKRDHSFRCTIVRRKDISNYLGVMVLTQIRGFCMAGGAKVAHLKLEQRLSCMRMLVSNLGQNPSETMYLGEGYQHACLIFLVE